MLLLDDLAMLYRRKSEYTFPDFLCRLQHHVHELQYHHGTKIIEVCGYLSDQLKSYIKEFSPIYTTHNGIITKYDFANQKKWFVPGVAAQQAWTGGTTNSVKFEYRRWADTFETIEGDCHYRAILREFKLDRPVQILYLMLDKNRFEPFIKTYRTNNILLSHGQARQALVHEVSRNKLFYSNYYKFYEEIIKYCENNTIDIIMVRGETLAALRWNYRRLKSNRRLAILLSSTGSKANRPDLDYMKSNGAIDHWCDHMRCWDGGATFITCPYHTYHLIDGLAWAFADGGRLISNDFFSLASPFYNYWNGDYTTIGDEYQRCKCGRYYRPFTIDRTRDVNLSGVVNVDIRNRILDSGIDHNLIKRCEAIGSFIRIIGNRPFSQTMRSTLREAFPAHKLNFVTEDEP